ncbi:hypothetical protein GXW78_00385 [Roseomonas terrae]|uniref:Periplasmic heavy metal sensor n=1 Tax=Neoroseomonas terrae TaxID=424799 RepID=A0ABS5EAQ4_9PROT|nr:hypothetical protein [Neoroseomonas terrae]MBR0648103.1 hypothetical protein [Neoroseomonas terrae]
MISLPALPAMLRPALPVPRRSPTRNGAKNVPTHWAPLLAPDQIAAERAASAAAMRERAVQIVFEARARERDNDLESIEHAIRCLPLPSASASALAAMIEAARKEGREQTASMLEAMADREKDPEAADQFRKWAATIRAGAGEGGAS